ncbi:MAG TPA: DUF6531 domain-containing protein, partial [Thermomicrobiales bacterium]|nr:DUF6531 domain-containing protein [Thermomicrobiales bacterium]
MTRIAAFRFPQWWRMLRVRSWHRIATLCMVALLLVGSASGILNSEAQRLQLEHQNDALAAPAPTLNERPTQEPLNQIAPPSPSGAYPPYPLNHTVDGESSTLGGEVANYDFETAPYLTGTPPANAKIDAAATNQGTQLTNADFATGTFTGWTATGGTKTTIETTGGPDGNWAKLTGSSSTITSAAFTPESDAQAITFAFGALTTSGNTSVYVYILSGATYSTSTLEETYACTACNAWYTKTVNISAYVGQSIKLKLVRGAGTLGLDRITKQILVPDLTIVDSFSVELDGSDPYLSLADKATTSAFTVATTTQQASVDLWGQTTGGDTAYLKILSGAGYSTVTTLTPSFTDTRSPWLFSLTAFLGQSIRLQIDVVTGRVGVDNIGLMHIAVPDWTVDSGTVTRVADEGGGTAAQVSGQITSAPVVLPDNVQHVTVRFKSGTSSFVWRMLTGPTFSTVVTLGGTLQSTTWDTATMGVSDYAGQTVKFQFVKTLNTFTVDNVGLFETVLPGWDVVDLTWAKLASDANGTYATAGTASGGLHLQSSLLNTGILDGAATSDVRSYVIAYSWSDAVTNSSMWVSWSAPDGSNAYLLGNFITGAANTYQTVRVPLYDFMPTLGFFTIHLVGGAKLYSLGDNIARQQVGEPFSQPVGNAIDSTTGAFSLSAVDLTVEGGPLPLVFRRYYNGHSDRYGELGYRWSHSYDTYLALQPNGSAAVVFGSGQEHYFEWNSFNSTFASGDPRVKSTLSKVTGQSYTYLYETKSGLRYAFTAAGDLISITDRNSQAITLYRDTNNRITTIADPAGREITLTYDSNGRLATATDPNGATVTYTYDGTSGDLVAVDKPEAARTEYDYDRHRLSEIRVRSGDDPLTATMVTVLTNTFDTYNRVTAQTDSLGNSFSLAWQTPANGVTTLTDARTATTAFSFDDHARTTFVDYPGDGDTGFTYTSGGYLDQLTNGANKSYTFGYDGSANPNAIQDPLGNPIAIGWGLDNLPTTVTDARGTITQNAYDAQGNLRQTVRDPADPGDPDPELDLMTRYEVNGAGLITKEVVDPAVDWLGVSRGSGRLNLVTVHQYDTHNNRTATIIDPTDPGDGDTELNLTWTWTFDDSGNITSETNPAGNTTAWDYDLLGRIITVRHVRSGIAEEIDIVYDLAGHIILLEDALGHQWQWLYDTAGNVTSRIDPKGKTWTYSYDDNNNLLAATNPGGISTAYTYDGENRVLTEAIDPTDIDPDVDLNLVKTQTWNAAGKVATVTNPRGDTWEYGYDASGHIINVTLPNTPIGGVYDIFY